MVSSLARIYRKKFWLVRYSWNEKFRFLLPGRKSCHDVQSWITLRNFWNTVAFGRFWESDNHAFSIFIWNTRIWRRKSETAWHNPLCCFSTGLLFSSSSLNCGTQYTNVALYSLTKNSQVRMYWYFSTIKVLRVRYDCREAFVFLTWGFECKSLCVCVCSSAIWVEEYGCIYFNIQKA